MSNEASGQAEPWHVIAAQPTPAGNVLVDFGKHGRVELKAALAREIVADHEAAARHATTTQALAEAVGLLRGHDGYCWHCGTGNEQHEYECQIGQILARIDALHTGKAGTA